MATNDAYGTLTFAEVAKRMAPDGKSLQIAEVLEQENPILQHGPWIEANDKWSHREVRRLSEPSGTWRKVNTGVGTEASRTTPVTDTIGLLESYAEIDVEIINMFDDKRKALADEVRAFQSGMGKELVATLLYGNTATAPEEFNGLLTRMGTLVTTANVLNAGGSGSDTTSILVVMWGEGKVFYVYPQNTVAGPAIMHEDLGIQTVSTSTTAVASAAQFQAYRQHFVARMGVVVKDERCIGRIANIESTGSSNIFNENDLITLLTRMPPGRKCIYVNDTVAIQMQIAAKDKNNIQYAPGNGEGLAGTPVVSFMQNPVYKLDQLLITETAIS